MTASRTWRAGSGRQKLKNPNLIDSASSSTYRNTRQGEYPVHREQAVPKVTGYRGIKQSMGDV